MWERDTWPSGPWLRAGRRRMSELGAGCPGLREAPDVRGSGRMSGLKWPNFGCLLLSMPDFRGKGRMSGLWRGAGCPGLAPDVRPLMVLGGWAATVGEVPGAGCPGSWPDVRVLGAISVFFFRRRFHASLADGVVVPWRLHSSSSSVKLRQYLCMHTSGVSSSIPSSKVSSEHV